MDALSTQIGSRKFPSARKGYDPAAVDSWLQKVGDLVAKLEDELRVARSRIEALERQTRDVKEADAVVQTAFLAAAESKAKLMAEAEAKASELIAQAEARAALMTERSHTGAVADAEALLVEARRKLEESERQAEARRAAAEEEAARIIEAARRRSETRGDDAAGTAEEAGAELQRLMDTLGALRQAVPGASADQDDVAMADTDDAVAEIRLGVGDRDEHSL